MIQLALVVFGLTGLYTATGHNAGSKMGADRGERRTARIDRMSVKHLRYEHLGLDGPRLSKTIVFAENNDHADFIAPRFNVNYPQYKGHFPRVVTYKTEYAQNIIDDFSAKEKMQHIAVSLDMLDTGINHRASPRSCSSVQSIASELNMARAMVRDYLQVDVSYGN